MPTHAARTQIFEELILELIWAREIHPRAQNAPKMHPIIPYTLNVIYIVFSLLLVYYFCTNQKPSKQNPSYLLIL